MDRPDDRPDGEPPAFPLRDEVERSARSILDAAWQPAGYTSPNLDVYPWMWLWDSCFHAIVWAELGDDRALTELASVFTWQTRDGFVPHMGFQIDPAGARPMWGRPGHSTITQPPMYAHAMRRIAAAGADLPDELLERTDAALTFFVHHRLRDDGLVRLVHPWESGCDDSPRWDSFTDDPFAKPAWDDRKQEMIAALDVTDHGSSVASAEFEVGAASFNALLAFNAHEFAELTGDREWRTRAADLATALDAHWDTERRTWLDAGEHDSRSAPVAEAALGLLVLPERSDAVWATMTDAASFGADFGPRQVDRRYPTYDGDGYWRGATWPQLNYLLWLALADQPAARAHLARSTVAAASRSGFAEYWNPDTAAPGGACPQSWTALAYVMYPDTPA